MPIIAMTIISSTSVKPASCLPLMLTNPSCQELAEKAPLTSPATYQVEYFVPSRPVPVDFEYTSKTPCPPYESDPGSSCMERKPHSAWPVIGSVGILRRNLTFLPCTSTPFTSVSRSGG